MDLDHTAKLRDLNDAFRRSFAGGKVMLTTGVRTMAGEQQARVLTRVRCFETFDRDNDPHQEHDFGSFELDGTTYFWKIDCYDHSLRFASPDPADPAQTTRVLTIMQAAEY